MKKASIPKPKFDVGDTVIYRTTIEDHHGRTFEKRHVGVIDEIQIRIGLTPDHRVVYLFDSEEIEQSEILKRVLAYSDSSEPEELTMDGEQ